MERISLLDHGYLRYIEHWGSDERIIEAGRQSVGGEFVSWESYEGHPSGDRGLLRHFHEKRNTGPFEFAGLIIEVAAPVAVIWQWVRHRTQSYAVMSSRYIPIADVHYLPTAERCFQEHGYNVQAAPMKGAERLTQDATERWIEELAALQRQSEETYRHGLEVGIPKEVARLALTFGRYFKMRCCANLHNWLRFLSLRMDEGAQHEIRQYANAVGTVIAELFPRTWELFVERGK